MRETADQLINLGIIGLGYTGRQHLEAAAAIPQVRVAAVAESQPTALASAPAALAVYPDWRNLLADADVEAISVCLPHFLHAEVALAALQAGKHLLIEKPLASTLVEAQRIAEAAAATDRVVMVEMTHRFYPPVWKGRELVLTGCLGSIYAVEEKIVQPVPPEGLPAWMMQRELAGGGVALTNGIHMLDRIGWVCGQDLTYHHGAAGWTQQQGDVEDTAMMQLSLADGTPVSLLAAWPRTDGPVDDELTVYGTEGTLRIWAWRGWRFEPMLGAPEEESSYPSDADPPARVRVGMTGALREFASAVVEGRPARPSAGEILEIQAIVDRFYRQVGTGS